MKKCLIVGASGYAGAQLAKLVHHHPTLELTALAVSETSPFLHHSFTQEFPQYSSGNKSLGGETFRAFSEVLQSDDWPAIDIVFFATPHQFSATMAAKVLEAGKQVYDLSGAFRLTSPQLFHQFYGFQHPAPELLQDAVYGLPELPQHNLNGASLVAVAGCYPTASIISLLPVLAHDCLIGTPVINAVSGVSGAGRAAQLRSGFCEVSLQAYSPGQHRHLPEIEQALKQPVIFTPHLGCFKRGIIATTTIALKSKCSSKAMADIYQTWSEQHPLVHYSHELPAIHHVEQTPSLIFSTRVVADGTYLQIFTAIDNLMKGAASSAIECCNLNNGWAQTSGLAVEPLGELAA